MKPKAVVKLAVDAAMTVLLLLLMAFELVGRAAHEWIGVGMFFLFVLHHLLNRGWTKRLFQGKYTPYRVVQTGVAALVFLAMLGSFASAVFISQEVFAFLPIRQGMALGRTVHLLCAYWGYLLPSLHLGLHWGMMVAMAGKKLSPSPRRRVVFNILGAAAALYGVFALFQRQIPTYLFLASDLSRVFFPQEFHYVSKYIKEPFEQFYRHQSISFQKPISGFSYVPTITPRSRNAFLSSQHVSGNKPHAWHAARFKESRP